MPAEAIENILSQAMAPCRHFEGACKDHCTWAPMSGHIPRGFAGATGALSEIKLIAVTAEPGDPADDETYSCPPDEFVGRHAAKFIEFLEGNSLRRNGRAAPFHRNLRTILNLFWPGQSLEQQLRSTWIVDAVLCSAKVSGGSFPTTVEATCVNTYLKPTIDLLPNAFVLTLGGKARARLTRNGVRIDGCAQHPSARATTRRGDSWQRASDAFHAWTRNQEQ